MIQSHWENTLEVFDTFGYLGDTGGDCKHGTELGLPW